jgi:hypothetical protein
MAGVTNSIPIAHVSTISATTFFRVFTWRASFASRLNGLTLRNSKLHCAIPPAPHAATFEVSFEFPTNCKVMLRLHHDGVSAREIGRTLGVARSTIQDNLGRARAAGKGDRAAPGAA